MSDLEPALVRPLIRGRFGEPYLYAVETPSTQQLLLTSDFPEGAVAVAEHQTAGRGRLGRAWSDTPTRALLCSVMLRPPASPDLAQLSLVAGLAVAEAVDAVAGVASTVKWPNDVLLDGRKLAGILLEGDGGVVVCGIGINVNQLREELPTGTRTAPTSLATASGHAHDRGAILAELLDRFARRYDEWSAGGLSSMIDALADRDAILGRSVRVGEVTGVAAGIEPDGALRIRTASGAVHLAVSGEVTLL